MKTDTRPADLAALRTELCVEVECVCNGRFFPDGASRDLWLAHLERHASRDPTSAIGAAMALVDGLQAEGWPGATAIYFQAALDVMLYGTAAGMDTNPTEYLLWHCPPALRPLVLTLAVLAARGGEWRRFLDLLTEAP